MSAIKKNKEGITVLVTGSIMQLFLGILYVWSVFVNPVSLEFNWPINSVKLTSSFMLCFFVFGIIAGGKLHLKIGSEKVVLLGGFMVAKGMFATAFLPQDYAWLMYFSYGITGGFGVGAAYNAIICAAQKWYPQRRGFATGVVVCAFGFSTVIFAPLVEILIKQFDLRNTFIILAAAFFIATVSLFKFIRLPDIDSSSVVSASITAVKNNKQIKELTVTEAIKTKEFYLITISLMAATATFFILNPSFKIYAAARGVESFGTIIVMMTGVASACGRLIVPILSDRIGREKAALTVISITSICAIVLCFAHGFLFIITVLFIAFCFGGLPGLYSVFASDYFGPKNAGANYGAIMMGFAISSLLFPILIRLIHNDIIKFLTLSGIAAVGIIMIIILMRIKRRGITN